MVTINRTALASKLCRASFYDFILQFWSAVISEKMVANWHIKFLADELQTVAERVFRREPKLYDLIINIPPGSTKSTICSEMFPAWCWTRDPTFRVICGSYAFPLALDLANRTKRIINSDKYGTLFPEIQLASEAKGDLETVQGGERISTTVGGSVTGRHGHCVVGTTLVDTSHGQKYIRDLNLSEPTCKILSYGKNGIEYRALQAVRRIENRRVLRITAVSGRVVEATPEHLFYSAGEWVEAKVLSPGSSLLCVVREEVHSPGVRDREAFQVGAQGVLLQSQLLSNATSRAQEETVSSLRKVDGAEDSHVLRQMPSTVGTSHRTPSQDHPLSDVQSPVQVGVAGIHFNQVRDVLQQRMCEPGTLAKNVRHRESQVAKRLSSTSAATIIRESVPVDTSSDHSEGRELLRGVPESETSKHSSYRPLDNEQCRVESGDPMRQVSQQMARGEGFQAIEDVVAMVEEVREEAVVWDIQVEGNANFFANGVLVHNCLIIDDPINPKEAVSDVALKGANEWFDHTLMSRMVDKSVTPVILIMQRLHQNDPTGHLLERSESTPIRHINLPALVSKDVRPRALRTRYVNGLFDPVRLPAKVLKVAEAEMGQYAFSGQYMQHPVPMGGGMFKTDQIKVFDNLPPMLRVIRFWDKAGTYKGGAFTVGAKMGLDKDRNVWIIDIIRGQWEASERERIIKQTAAIDGKKVMVGIEQEPGSGGKESAQNTMKNLLGYRIWIDRPVGDKQIRADPFAVQVNGGNVRMVAGPWNTVYLNELMYFPFSRYKDQVDASAACFAVLTGKRMVIGGLGAKGGN